MTKHGLYKAAEYDAWINMKARCYNKNHESYPNYGARGVVVCRRWLHSFENFFADVGKRPTRKHSLDRFPKWDGNYEPKNVRWATKSQQMRNRIPSEKFLAAVRKNVARGRKIMLALGGVPHDKKTGRFICAGK